MIIIMPNDHRGLTFFHNEAMTRLQDSNFDGNIVDEALDALERRRKVHEVHVINMPSFKVDTNMDVQKHLRTVNTLFIHIIAYYFFTKVYAVTHLVPNTFKAQLGETSV